MREHVITILDASKQLGVAPIVVSTLIRGHQIPTHPVPYNGKAKGLTQADVARIQRLLGPTPRHKSRSSVASSTH
jgi:hypothetical protein